ncbi:MAG: RhuM family protein [Dermatophilaceae bacterium]
MNEERGVREPAGEVVVYEGQDGGPRVDVQLVNETVWLTQDQMAELFGRERSVITKHLNNVYASGELVSEATRARLARVQIEGGRTVTREIEHYNLDAILSVGYRVNSHRGTQFRIWATNTLRDHLVRGYTLNEQRLHAKGVEFEQAVALLSSTLRNQQLITDEGQAVLEVVQRYARSWRFLRAYDEDQLSAAPEQTGAPVAELNIAAARGAIRTLRDDLAARGENPGLLGQERGDALESILAGLEQTWGGDPLYPTIESRAAHLLYFVIKDHPLIDGNKRSGSLLFLEYLRRNGALLTSTGEPRFSDSAHCTARPGSRCCSHSPASG